MKIRRAHTPMISATRTINGYWVLTTIKNNFMISRVFIGYTKNEAIRAFKSDLRLL